MHKNTDSSIKLKETNGKNMVPCIELEVKIRLKKNQRHAKLKFRKISVFLCY